MVLGVAELGAAYFDQWYDDMTGSAILEAAKQRHLGLPPELMSTSGLTFDGVQEIARDLALGADDTLLDLACGRGGYGLWIAQASGSRLIGVDFSAVALQQARASVARFGLDPERVEFRVGQLVATGLPDTSVDAAMVIDSVQFADDPVLALRECYRVLRPGGQIVVTCWEPRDRADASVSERLRRVDLTIQLPAAGFADVKVRERPEWRAAERGMWEEAFATDPGNDPALQSWHNEATRVLPNFDALRRVYALAHRP